MFINRIYVSNFKSFEKLDLKLQNLNVIIGANASGKSNFLGILHFLRNISNYGLVNAISMEGGIEYVRNSHIKSSENFTIRVQYVTKENTLEEHDGKYFGIKNIDSDYEFSLQWYKRKSGFKIISDRLTINYEVVEISKKNNSPSFDKANSLGFGKVVYENRKQKVHVTNTIPDDIPLKRFTTLPLFVEGMKLEKNELILETPIFGMANRFQEPFDNIPIYDFDPKLPKKSVSITGKNDLDEDGTNLSIVLNRILKNPDDKRKLINLVSDLLPFVKDLRVQKLADKSVIFSIGEDYYSDLNFLPAPFISDGTVNILAIIAVLYFEENKLIVFEEPERNIHPKLLSKLVSMIKEVSEKGRQIIITTHNPEFIKNTEIDDLLLISRNMDGYSEINRPSQSSEVRMFLENEIGIDELFTQGLLEGIHEN